MLVARVVFFTFFATRKVLVADMPQFVPVVGFAVVGVICTAGRGVVLPANVVFGLLLLGLLLVEVYEGPCSLPLPGCPSVCQLVCCEERQLVFPVEGIPKNNNNIKYFYRPEGHDAFISFLKAEKNIMRND
jgi:hypothetical protein